MAQDTRLAGTTATAATAGSPAARSSTSFKFPHYYNFPPMFTLQPNLNTRRAQLDKWSALVLAYCRHYRIFRLVVSSAAAITRPAADHEGPVRVGSEVEGVKENDNGAPLSPPPNAAAATADDDDDVPRSIAYYAPDLFRNHHIDRALAPTDAREVLEDLRRQGRVEFEAASSQSSDNTPDIIAFVYWKTPEEWAAVVEAYVDETAQRGSVLTLYELTAGDATRGSELHGLDPTVLQRALAVLVKRGKAQVFGAEESLGVKFF